jgi:hypothetical protein
LWKTRLPAETLQAVQVPWNRLALAAPWDAHGALTSTLNDQRDNAATVDAIAQNKSARPESLRPPTGPGCSP